MESNRTTRHHKRETGKKTDKQEEKQQECEEQEEKPYEKEQEKLVKLQDAFEPKEFADFGTITYTEKTRASIKVQDGCDRFCSYCIIPYARGRVRSRKQESILEEIKQVSEKGIKEVVNLKILDLH